MQLLTIAASVPQVSLRLTDVSMLAYAPGDARNTLATLNAGVADTTIRDCEFYSAYINWGDSSYGDNVGITNSLFHRCSVTLYDISGGMSANLFNNLFRYGSLSLMFSSFYWNAYNNLFDNVSPYVPGTVNIYNGNNGYINASQLSGGTGNVTVTTPDYQTGPLGRWYYPTSGTNLFNLVNAGSTTAAGASLYHYTTRTDQTKDTGNVDVGYHYIALDSSGQPTDNDGDGIPDYLEDRNGNGIVDSGESAWTFFINGFGGLTVFTPLQP